MKKETKKTENKAVKPPKAAIVPKQEEKAVEAKEMVKDEALEPQEEFCINGFTETKVRIAENFISKVNRYTTLDSMANVIYQLKGVRPNVAGCGSCMFERFKNEIKNYATLGRATLNNFKKK